MIIATGGNGLLCTELKKYMDALWLTKQDLDITNDEQVWEVVMRERPRIILHTAAWTDVAGAESNRAECWNTNVHGTSNLVRAAKFVGAKLVYISTDYVFDGEQGGYKPTDTPNPVNYYALTKLVGEGAVYPYKNSLIIRTSFKPSTYLHPGACTDMWTSADYVDVIAAMMPNLITSWYGVHHLGTSRKSVYDLVRQRNPDVRPITRADVATPLPKDVSFSAECPHMDWEDL